MVDAAQDHAELDDCWTMACRLPQTLRRVHSVTVAEGFDGAEHHSVPTLVVCLCGVVRVEMSTGKIDLHAGEAAVIAPGVPHLHAPLRRGSASLGQGFLLGQSDLEIDTPTRHWWLCIDEQPARQHLESALLGREDQRLKHVRAALRGVQTDATRPVAPMPEAVRRMWMYLRARRFEPIAAADIIRASGLRASQAHASFKAYFTETPHGLLMRHRLDYVRYLVQQGFAIEAVARRSGFSSRRHLTAAFTAAFGCSPRAWRRAVQEGS